MVPGHSELKGQVTVIIEPGLFSIVCSLNARR